ncbi:MAG: GNAT family N-acetyltransferase [Patescibacteria group bacterium]
MQHIQIIPGRLEEIQKFEKIEWDKFDVKNWGKVKDWKLIDYKFCAVVEEITTGIIYGKFEAGSCYIDTLIVADAFRNMGIGTKLIKHVEEWTKDHEGIKTWLLTQKDWQANKFYIKQGYNSAVILKKHFLGQDYVLYEKFLD